MAPTFLEPGTSPTQGFELFSTTFGTVTSDSSVIHHGSRSIKVDATGANAQSYVQRNGVTLDAGTRVSFYFQMPALFGNVTTIWYTNVPSTTNILIRIRVSAAGVLQLFEHTNQIGSNGSTLVAGNWYRISLAYTVTNTTVNEFRLYLDSFMDGRAAALDISVSNATLSFTGASGSRLGFINTPGASKVAYFQSYYIDNDTSLLDPGNVRVTAKRPFANGGTNGFTTQIGSGGSGYGSGHAPQVNEQPLSTTNGWSMVVSGVATTEEYTIEAANVGVVDISSFTIIAQMGWIYAKSLTGETAKIILNNVQVNALLTTAALPFFAFSTSATYPTGTHDVGMVTATTVTTVSLYEAGIIFAYIFHDLKKLMGTSQSGLKKVNGVAVTATKKIARLG